MKVITLRLSDEEYKLIAEKAKAEYRSISNYITAKVLSRIQESMYVDRVEEEEIKLNKELQKRIKRGLKEAKHGKGRLIG